MKRLLLTYLSLVLILSSVFLTPLSVIASEVTTDDLNTETISTSTSDDTEIDVKENANDESTTK
ncbi:MAG TPA: hypothetical protein VK068_00475, partial [Jeotgalicoccus sp.]|nr:hypothetical protein [Jeotgalicoccus sp.]